MSRWSQVRRSGAGRGLRRVRACRAEHSPLIAWRVAAVGLGALVLSAVGLSGCAGLAPTDSRAEVEQRVAWAERSAVLDAIEQWRLIARAEVDTGRGFYPFTLVWRAESGEDVIDASGPSGQGGGRLRLRVDGAELQLRSGERYRDANADALAAALFGVEVPVRAARNWLRAMPMDDDGRLVFDADQRLMALRSGDWEVRYLAYARQGESTELPALPADIRIENRRLGVEIRVREARWFLRLPSPDGPLPVAPPQPGLQPSLIRAQVAVAP